MYDLMAYADAYRPQPQPARKLKTANKRDEATALTNAKQASAWAIAAAPLVLPMMALIRWLFHESEADVEQLIIENNSMSLM